jgi:hypothetical protein
MRSFPIECGTPPEEPGKGLVVLHCRLSASCCSLNFVGVTNSEDSVWWGSEGVNPRNVGGGKFYILDRHDRHIQRIPKVNPPDYFYPMIFTKQTRLSLGVTSMIFDVAHMGLRVHIHIYIYIDILHVNLKCYLLTNICQMVILKHRKYLFSIWFSAFFGVVPCIYIYSTYQFAAPTEIGLRCSAVIVQGMIVQTAGFQAQADGHIPQSTNVVR